MKTKTVIIVIEVPMNNEQSKEWGKKSDYFEESVKESLREIEDLSKLKSCTGEILTDSECAKYKVIIN
jgi:hypothetical protein